MHDWQKDILSRLENYSDHQFRYDQHALEVKCDNPESAKVSIVDTGDDYQVHFGGWHEHFDQLHDALKCFVYVLSEESRLKVTLRGGTECAWTLQSKENDVWVDDTTTSLLIFPFWKRKHHAYWFNKLPRKP